MLRASVAAMEITPESVCVMGARATESGQNTSVKSKISQIVRADCRGWLVCLAVLIINVVRSGIADSFGIFIVELEKAFPDMTMAQQSQYFSNQHRTFSVVAFLVIILIFILHSKSQPVHLNYEFD